MRGIATVLLQETCAFLVIQIDNECNECIYMSEKYMKVKINLRRATYDRSISNKSQRLHTFYRSVAIIAQYASHGFITK